MFLKKCRSLCIFYAESMPLVWKMIIIIIIICNIELYVITLFFILFNFFEMQYFNGNSNLVL